MALSSAEQMRRWQGPALFSFGFRPFFLLGTIWAGVAMVLWVLALAGQVDLPTQLDPVSWHTHAFLFGYLGAAIAGFLLTAVPNWTGRLPVVGTALIALVALWLVGRVALLFSAHIPFALAGGLDIAFPVVLGGVILREIVSGRNWRNLPVFVLLGLFTLSDLLFLLDAARGGYAAGGLGMRLGVGSVLMMIALIGGRIIPSFTRNWLVKVGHAARPVPPMQRLDVAVLGASGVALSSWVAAPDHPITAALLLVVGALQIWRVSRWRGLSAAREPILAVLHVSYLFWPLGAMAVAMSILWPGLLSSAGAVHLWTAGAIGGMTLAVMSRASLGHTGQELRAGRGTLVVYAAIFLATVTRFLAGFAPSAMLYDIAGTFWCIAFLGFALVYGPLLWRPRQ